MDASRFDAVARAIGHRLSRRAAVRAGGGLVVAAGLGPRRAAVRAQDATPVGGEGTPSPGLLVRPNAKSLDTTAKQAFVDAVLALKEKPSPWIDGVSAYDTFVLWHRDAFSCDIDAAHMGAAFLPWHRAFLLLFEQQLQSVDPSVVLPYWDWAVDSGKDSYLWQDDLMGGNGDPSAGYAVTTGPFRQGEWEIAIFDYGDSIKAPYLIRDFGAGDLGPTLPTEADVEGALAVATYDAPPWNATSPIAESFRNTLEGWRDCVDQTCDPINGVGPACTGGHELHNRVHLWVAGEFLFAHEQAMAAMIGMATPPAQAAPNSPAGSVEILGTMAANSSPSDPVFFLHHANIDRIWNLWLARHGQVYLPETGGPYGHNIDDAMWPYLWLGTTYTPRMMLDSRALGYVYDTDEQG
jgi:tyrosinase